MDHIGLLMTCNEEDCITEVMNEHTKYFDKILVLDGSTDRTEEIIRSYKAVKYFLKDKDIIDKMPGKQFKDGARQFILEKAQEMFGFGGWFTILHGDEIFYDNPVEMAEQAEKTGAEKINWYAMNFFLHTTDQERNLAAIKSVQERVIWYCPGFLEIRSFKNKRGIHYRLEEHARCFPHGIGWKIFHNFPIYKHYPYRSVAQIIRKRNYNANREFSASYGDFNNEASCFLDLLPGYKVARKYDGSFHEFEVAKQGTLLARWLRAHRYMPCKIGPFEF
jgi:glycosyltransferase involved in cell wall biosynthesis